MPEITKINVDRNNNPVWKRLVELACKREIKVCFADIDTGVFFRTDKRRYIFIGKNIPEPKRSFILAHELGHAVLHLNTNNALYFKDEAYHDRIEGEADRFAGKLIRLLDKRERFKKRPEFDPDPPAIAGVVRQYVVTTAVSGIAA